MTAEEKHNAYLNAIGEISIEDMEKLIKEGGMVPVLLIDIGRTLAILADAVSSIANTMKGGTDEEAGEGYQSSGGNEPGHVKKIHGGLPEGDPEA